ncbi:BlaI/MecI/CopY family transcriptional regulator [bacterium SCSIO 12741]|nr:BlaI/MecI/CopY family transcriptional regulator [bacterium SCSIO 12741]
MELTKAEEQIMQVLWKLKRGVVHDIIAELPDPKPAYTTVSTLIRILEKKGFVDHKAYGKTYEYFPKISRKKYSGKIADRFLQGYFDGSTQSLVSFFVKEKKLSTKELEEILKQLKSDS